MSNDNSKSRGYFKFALAVDCETTGLAIGCDDPSYNDNTGELYQAISWGMVVVDGETFEPVDELYVEIQYDNKSVWNTRAEGVHGLSRKYLAENGMTQEDAVVEIASLILKYWGPDVPVVLIGHNVATFDLPFLRRTLRTQDINIKFANRHLDSWSVGYTTLQSYNSDDLFECVGLPVRDPTKHNALDDAHRAVEALRRIRAIYNHVIEGN